MGLIEIFYPKMCVACRREGQYICLDCQQQLRQPEGICPMCTRPSLDGWTHPRCRKRGGMERLLVGLPYRGMVQDCLKKVKYKSSWNVMDFLFSLCKFGVMPDNFVVTAVPMFAQKERERGFNQAQLVAELFAQNYKVPYLVTLERTRQTKPMFGLTKKERQENIEGAFSIKDQKTKEVKYQRIILVDDVWTTGATMRECAKMLKRAGVREVWGVTLAR